MSLIEVNDLTKDYGHGRGVFHISLHVDKGECYGFLGPNGAGKTTTIRHLMGFSKPQTGVAVIDGKNCRDNSALLQNIIGYLPGEISLPTGVTGTKFLEMMAKMRGIKDNAYCKMLVDRFELDPNVETKQMSLGVKRKLAVVTAFMHDPEILILDEPTSGLDPVMQQIFIDFIKGEKERGKTIFLSSHIFREVDATADRIAIIKDGKIVSEFEPEILKNESDKIYGVTYEDKTVRVRVKNFEINQFISELAEKNVKDFREYPFTLEDYFMQFYKEDKTFEGGEVMGDYIINAEHITKDYGSGRGIFDINIKVEPGEVFGYVGTNGSGKTTTIRNIMGFIRPDKGTATVLGQDSWAESADIMKKVSYVPGEIAFPTLPTGTAFLKLQAEYLGVKSFNYMNELIEKFQLDPTANLKRMSKGMKQKTALVAALMGDKEVLILDEPTTGLDPLMRDVFLELIREEKQKGHTVFMSSHIFTEIEEVCDKVAMIKDGKIVDTVSLEELRNPKKRNLDIEFCSEDEKNSFLNSVNFQLNSFDGMKCQLSVPTEELNVLFGALRNFRVNSLHENSVSLEQHFMNIYKKGKNTYGNK